MWYLVYSVAFWIETRLIPFAYGEEYEDPVCPSAKIPVHILEYMIMIPVLLIDIVLIPIYVLIHCIRRCIVKEEIILPVGVVVKQIES